MATVRISLNEDIERILEYLKGDYPALDYPELFKLALSELYRNRELEARTRWAAGLPVLELREDEKQELKEALDEADREPGTVLTLDDLKTRLKKAAAD